MYRRDKEWEESYASQVIHILMQLLPYLVELTTASIEMDIKCATDFTIKLKGGNIAVRLRRPDCSFRDWTVRALRDSGAMTELEKIKAGHGFRYFYGWIDENGRIAEWILIDLDKVREMGLLDKDRSPIPNRDPTTGKPDGTYFVAIKVMELDEADCLIIHQLNNQLAKQIKKSRQVNLHPSIIEGRKRAEQRQYGLHEQPKASLSAEDLKAMENIPRFRLLQGRGENDD